MAGSAAEAARPAPSPLGPSERKRPRRAACRAAAAALFLLASAFLAGLAPGAAEAQTTATFSGGIVEAEANDGSVTGSVTLTITGNTFIADITSVCAVSSTPTGLTPVFTRDSDTQITLSYTGNAGSHDADPTESTFQCIPHAALTTSATVSLTHTFTIDFFSTLTAPPAPAAPTVAATADSDTSLDVSWTEPDHDGPVTGYDLQYRAGTSGSFTDGPQDATGTSAAITGLQAGTSYQVQVRATNAAGDSGWSASGTGMTTGTANSAPTANAGTDQTVAEGASVTLSGSGTDPDSDTLTYAWMQTSGTTVALSSATAASPTFTAPELRANEDLVFSLTVNDGTVDSTADTVTVSVTADDDPPTANAGADQTVAEGASVTLSGSGTDPDSGTLTYAWAQTDSTGTTVTLANAAAATASFTAPSGLAAQTALEFTLTVSDGTTDVTDSQAVTVTLLAPARVTDVAATGVDGGLRVTWSAAARATGYRVQWKSGTDSYNTGDRQAAVSGGAATSHTITGLTAGTTYTVRVTATRTGVADDTVMASAEVTGTPMEMDAGPSVTQIVFNSSPASGDTFGFGETIQVDVGMSPQVAVTGTPRVPLDIGGTTRYAEFRSVSGFGDVSGLVFEYTVQGGDADTDGISVAANGLELNGGTIAARQGGAAANLAHAAIAADATRKVDGGPVRASVTEIVFNSSPASGDTFGFGETVRVDVAMSPQVAVTGTPRVRLDIGGVTKYADFSSVSGFGGVSGLVFVYAVQAGDRDTDGISVPANGLELNGGTINEGNVAANLAHAAIATDANRKVDGGTARSAAWAGGFAEAAANDGSVTGSVTATLTGDTFAAGAASGAGVTVTNLPSGLTASYALDSARTVLTLTLTGRAASHANADDVSGLTVTLADAAFTGGNAAAVTNREKTGLAIDFRDAAPVANNAPAFASATATRSLPENTPAGRNIGAPVTATDADGDDLTYTLGGTDAASFVIVSTSGQLRTGSAAYDFETRSSYSVTVTASDGNGGSDSIDVTITLTDVDETTTPSPPPPPSNNPPTAEAGAARTVDPGGSVTLSGSGTDPDNDTLTFLWRQTAGPTVTLAGADTARATFTAPPDLTEDTALTFTLTVSDGRGGSATDAVTVTVRALQRPLAPTGLTARADGESAIALSWIAPAADARRAAVTGYDVQYRLASTAPDGTWTDHAHDGTAVTATVTGLDPGAEYELQVRATSSAGGGPYSAVASAVTDTAPVADGAAAVPRAGGGEVMVTTDNGVVIGIVHRGGETVLTFTAAGSPLDGMRLSLPAGTAEVTAKRLAALPDGAAEPPPGTDAPDDLLNAAVELVVLPAGARVCLPFDADAGGPALYRFDGTRWVLTGREREDGLVCGIVAMFSPFVVFYERSAAAALASAAKAWLARFGRTVADHVVDAVGWRMETGASGSAQAVLAGERIPLRPSSGRGTDADAARAQAVTDWLRGERDKGDGARLRSRAVPERELLTGSSFRLPLGAAADGDVTAGAGVWTMWGRGQGTRFDSGGGVSVDGEVLTGTLGLDWARGGRLAGVAVSHSAGEGEFDAPAVAGGLAAKGGIESALTAVSPYAKARVHERIEAWGVLGYGTGRMTLDCRDAGGGTGRASAGIRMAMGAVGARGEAVAPGPEGGLGLAVKADARAVRTESDGADGLPAVSADATRLRLALEGRWEHRFEGGAMLTPVLEVGLRHDGGDAGTGAGAEAGGGLSYADPALGLTAELSGRALVAHADGGYREWGAGGAVTLDPGADGLGLSFRLAPSWGADAGGPERLWTGEAGALTGLATGDGVANDNASALRLGTELGYGLPAPGGNGVLTPWGGFALAEGGARRFGLGARLELAPAFRLAVEGQRRNGNAGPEHTLMLRGSLRW